MLFGMLLDFDSIVLMAGLSTCMLLRHGPHIVLYTEV